MTILFRGRAGHWECARCGRVTRSASAPVSCQCRRPSSHFPTIPTADHRSQELKPAGPGVELGKILTRWGFFHTETCACKDFSRQMNHWGVDGCREKLDSHIVPWLVEQFAARKQNPEGLSLIAKGIVATIPEKAVPILARRAARKAIKRASEKELSKCQASTA